MSKKSNSNLENFYEALSSTTSEFNSWFQRISKNTGQTNWRNVQNYLDQTRELAQALGNDLARNFKKVLELLRSKTAKRSYFSLLLVGTIAATISAVLIGTSTLTLYAQEISNPTMLLNKKNSGTTILDRNGETLFRVYGANNLKPVSVSEVPKHLINATLAAEDANFYNHDGFSFKATIRALYQDVVNRGKIQGGSTITQQLIKNSLLTSEKSFFRKYQEILLATELERRYSKNEIMEMYLNKIYYGQGSFGIESAAQTYFHKSARELTLAESALLAGLPLGPSRFDPNFDPEAALARRNYILERMQALGFSESNAVAEAKRIPIQASAHQIELRAPHFVFYVLDQLRREYGDELVEKGGITVYTTLDLSKQREAERIVREQVAGLKGRHATNGGLVSMHPVSGEISSMVGSIDYNEPNFGRVNVTTARFQPGSAFKPFAYLTAFKKGWNGATQVQDKPMAIPNYNGTVYRPENYDGKFRGPVLLRRALANSLNIPAIEVLRHAGIHDTLQTAREMGITGLADESRYGLSLVLGGAEVRPVDMAGAYASIANLGVKTTPKAILKVLDRNQKDVTKTAPEQEPTSSVIDPRLAYMIINILSDNDARSEIFGSNSPLKLSHPAFVKTGTTNDWRDNWAVGSTTTTTTVVWVGNNDHSPMINVDGITGAAPIWHNYMEVIMRGQPAINFSRPAGLIDARVCSSNGGQANPWDKGINELFLIEQQPKKRCNSQQPKPEEPKENRAEEPPEKPDEDKEDLPEEDEDPRDRPGRRRDRPLSEPQL